MLIPVSIGDCRIAVKAAIEAAEKQLVDDRKTIRDKSFQQLHDGAVHNGLKPSQSDLQNMNDMVDRDMDHMMESHPAKHVMEVHQNLLAMLDYTDEIEAVIIDDQDFRLLRPYLPVRVEAEKAA